MQWAQIHTPFDKTCITNGEPWKVDGKTSTTAGVSSRIPQGSVLGPILSLIFINDFPLVIQAFIKLFADDAKIYQIVSSMTEVAQLQDVLDNSVDWALV